MAHVVEEIASQPECWLRAADLAAGAPLPAPGARVAAVGCGTSWQLAQAYAALRELAGAGETDAHCCSEYPPGRRYDHVVAISRSGATAEVLQLLRQLRGRTPTTVVTAVGGSAATQVADQAVLLPFAVERSIQTRFPTSVLAMLRTHLGGDIRPAVAAAHNALALDPEPASAPANPARVVFLGAGWTVGLAHLAAMTCREMCGMWAESYPAMEYRHGPAEATQPGQVTWLIGETGTAGAYAAEHSAVVPGQLDPLADLVRIQRFAVAAAQRRGRDPDRPLYVTWAVT